jgi:hypothetical protein
MVAVTVGDGWRRRGRSRQTGLLAINGSLHSAMPSNLAGARQARRKRARKAPCRQLFYLC